MALKALFIPDLMLPTPSLRQVFFPFANIAPRPRCYG